MSFLNLGQKIGFVLYKYRVQIDGCVIFLAKKPKNNGCGSKADV